MNQTDLVANDQLDRQRVALVLSGFTNALLGVDPSTYDPSLVNPVGQHQVLNVTTGTATQGQAATVSANIAGYQITLPMILIAAGALWFIARKKG